MKNQISNLILKNIKNLKKDEYSKPIFTAGGNIILKLNSKEKNKKIIDKEKELQKLINSERNRILNEYSIIYYK